MLGKGSSVNAGTWDTCHSRLNRGSDHPALLAASTGDFKYHVLDEGGKVEVFHSQQSRAEPASFTDV